MSKGITLCLIIVGLINFVPVVGVLSAQELQGAYDVALSSNDLIILMRHRALLFGIFGGFILFSAFVPSYQAAAMVMAGISMVGFAVLVHSVGGFNASINKVLIVDYVGIVLLSIAAFFKYGVGRS